MNRRVARGWGRALLTSLAAAVLLTAPVEAASRYDPRLRFKTIATPRFDVHFHQGQEAAGRRLAVIAEDVATTLDGTLGPALGRVQVVLVNQSDMPNGWATPVPYNLIEIAAAGPGGESALGNTDDWLRLVFTHEYTHVVHLGRSRGWIGGLRHVFGRHPALFPNLTLPLWSIEGMATFEESTPPGRGRVNAGDFRQIVARAAAGSRFEPIDRVGGGLDDWPAGNGSYAYGGLFHRYLADTYGAGALRRLTDETGGRLPYLGFTAYPKVFGRSLGNLWSDFAADMHSRSPVPDVKATRLTFHGFSVAGPRFAADGTLYYSVVNPRGFPALMALAPGAAEPRIVAERYLGERIGVADQTVVFDQMEITANVGLQRDLYAVTPGAREPVRLTRGRRAGDPDVSPDGRRVVFTSQRDDRRDLSIALLQAAPKLSIGVIDVLASAPDTEFSAPRWSPDGRWIAVERRVRGALPAIAIVDAASGATSVVAAAATARCVTPAWLPDGRVMFAADQGGEPFRLFRVEASTGSIERLEGAGASAQAADVSADGRAIAFLGYTPDGYDLFMLPLATAQWVPVAWDTVATANPSPAPAAAVVSHYTPWATLAPRFWTPTVEFDSGEVVAGAAAGGGDALGRQAYFATVQWSASRARPDWQASYAYDRWRPTLFASVTDDTDPFRGGTAQTTELNAGVLVPWRRVRRSQSILAALHASTDTLQCADCAPPIDTRIARRALRAGYAFTSTRTYGYSISREQGWSLSATEETVLRALGSDGDAGSIVADVRRYQRLWPPHAVLAARFAAAHSWGDEVVRREFTAAGSDPGPGGFVVDADAIGLLRGFEDDERGWHAMVANLDYRVPLLRIERGVWSLPAFVRSLHGAIFVDAGHAWSEGWRSRDARVSLGAELSVDTVLGYVLPVTLAGGAAWRHDGLDRQSGAALFGRIGYAF